MITHTGFLTASALWGASLSESTGVYLQEQFYPLSSAPDGR